VGGNAIRCGCDLARSRTGNDHNKLTKEKKKRNGKVGEKRKKKRTALRSEDKVPDTEGGGRKMGQNGKVYSPEDRSGLGVGRNQLGCKKRKISFLRKYGRG